MGGNHQPKDGIAEKFQSLVRFVTRVFGAPRPVSHGEREKVRIGERATDPISETEERVGRQGISPGGRPRSRPRPVPS